MSGNEQKVTVLGLEREPGRNAKEEMRAMKVGVRLGLATAKICTALLLVVMIAIVIHDRDVAFRQNGTRSQVPPYTAIDLTPDGVTGSLAWDISGGQQVGDLDPMTTNHPHALLWRGSAANMVDLNPTGSLGSDAFGVCGGQQVGGISIGDYPTTTAHAALWRGSAASVVDLNPPGFGFSVALGTSRGEQVGRGAGTATGGDDHALLWRGSAASVVDLQPRGFERSEASATSDDHQVGWGVLRPYVWHALLWRGSVASMVDLHPHGFVRSVASGISGDEQVGSGVLQAAPSTGPGGSPAQGMLLISGSVSFAGGAWHALLWRGSAGTVVDLHPRGFISSGAYRTNGHEQVGSGIPQDAPLVPRPPLTGPNAARFPAPHALLWQGSADTVVDLHAFLPPGFAISSASRIDSAGDIVGSASAGHDSPSHALLWKRNVPKPGTSRGPNPTGC